MLVLAVVIYKYYAATDVAVFADGSVPYVRKMTCFSTVSQCAVFQFDVVTYAAVISDYTSLSYVCVGSYSTVLAHCAVGYTTAAYLSVFAYMSIVKVTETLHHTTVL